MDVVLDEYVVNGQDRDIVINKEDEFSTPITGNDDLEGFVDIGFHGEHVLEGDVGFGEDFEPETGEYG